VRAMKFPRQPRAWCPIIRFVVDADKAALPAPTAMPVDGAAAAVAAAEPVASQAKKAKNVPPLLFEAELLEGPMPHPPDSVKSKHANEDVVGMYKVCAGTDGAIQRAQVVVSIPGADGTILDTIRKWRLKPQPLPICAMQRFVFSVRPPRQLDAPH